MPEHKPLPIAQLVESLQLVLPTAPHSQHVVVGLYRVLDDPLVGLRVADTLRDEVVVGDVVGPLGEEGQPIYGKVEGWRCIIENSRLLDELSGLEADVDDLSIIGNVGLSCAVLFWTYYYYELV